MDSSPSVRKQDRDLDLEGTCKEFVSKDNGDKGEDYRAAHDCQRSLDSPNIPKSMMGARGNRSRKIFENVWYDKGHRIHASSGRNRGMATSNFPE